MYSYPRIKRLHMTKGARSALSSSLPSDLIVFFSPDHLVDYASITLDDLHNLCANIFLNIIRYRYSVILPFDLFFHNSFLYQITTKSPALQNSLSSEPFCLLSYIFLLIVLLLLPPTLQLFYIHVLLNVVIYHPLIHMEKH